MKENIFKNKTIMYSVIVLLAVLIITIATTVAYYRTSISGTNGSLSIKSATINGVTFTAESITASSDILPGWSSGDKTLTVSVNNTDYDIPYECTLNVSSNEITDMYLYVSGTNAYTANNGVPVTSGAMRLTAEGAKLTSSTKSTSMTYKLIFKETGVDQSSQQGKAMSATVTCSLDGVNKLYYSNGSTGVRAIAYDSDGNPVTVTVSNPDSSLMSSITASPTTYGLTTEQVSNSKLIGLAVDGTGSRTVKVAVSDVASVGESIKVLHYVNDAWTALEGTYLVDENGEITITSDSFSPFLLANVGVKAWEIVTDSATVGTIDTGDLFKLNGTNERFYVLSNNGEMVTMLSEWNLYAGGSYDNDNSEWTEYSTPTGLQDSTMKGYVSDQNVYNGTIIVSKFDYFNYLCSSYPCDIDLTDSNVSSELLYYKNYLIAHNADIQNIRLIKHTELLSLGCVYDQSIYNYDCSTFSSWLYQTTYWTMTFNGLGDHFYVSTEGTEGAGACLSVSGPGLRPVIEISLSDL